MPMPSRLLQRLAIRYPIIQAPMAGGGDTPALVAAVSAAGGLGCIGAAYLTPEQIGETARAVRASTDRPFGINLFATVALPEVPTDLQPALQSVARYYTELTLPPPAPPALPPAAGDSAVTRQVTAILETGAAMLSFTFGLLPAEAIAAAKQRGLMVVGTATSVEEAIALQQAGVDAVVAQGGEAGGHRGSFLTAFEAAAVGTMALVPQIVDAVTVPVIASGGIMDGRGIVAAQVLGAEAVQMGTAFLACDESGAAAAYKAAMLNARETSTRITRAFSGRPARGIVNRAMAEIEQHALAHPEALLPFPLQNTLTRAMRTAATKQNRAEYLSLWAGQGVGLARRQGAKVLMERLIGEIQAAERRLQPAH